MKYLRVSVLLVLSVIPAMSILAECSATEVAALEALDRSFTDSTRKGDRAALDALYANDFRGSGVVRAQNKAEVIDGAIAAAERNRNRPSTTTSDHYVISCTPVTATITHRNVTDVANGVPTYTRSVHVLEKRGGRWQMLNTLSHPVSDSGMIGYLEREWADSERKHDGAWKERNFADDYMGVSARNGALMTKAQEVADTASGAWSIQSGDISDFNVRVDGNMAIATGVYHVKGTDEDKKPFAHEIRYIDTFAKRDGRWLAVSSQGTLVSK